MRAREGLSGSSGCERVLGRLSPYLDRELAREESLEIGGHLEGCGACRRAHVRNERLERISARMLAAPAVLPAEWGIRSARLDRGFTGPRAVLLAARRARRQRSALLAFAAAAGLLVAATLVLPLLLGGAASDHSQHLCFAERPNANEAEVVDLDCDYDRYYVDVSYPADGSPDAVTILLSKYPE